MTLEISAASKAAAEKKAAEAGMEVHRVETLPDEHDPNEPLAPAGSQTSGRLVFAVLVVLLVAAGAWYWFRIRHGNGY